MKLLSGTISPATAISSSCCGAFTAPGSSEVVVVRGNSVLELWGLGTSRNEESADFPKVAQFHRIGMLNTFSTISAVSAFKIEDEKGIAEKDLLIITGESGFVTVLRYVAGTEVADGQAKSAPGSSIEYIEDYSTHDSASPFFPMLYFPLHSVKLHDEICLPAHSVIGGGWERVFHSKIDRSALTGRVSPVCCQNTHVAIQPNCVMLAAIEQTKICIQLGKLAKSTVRYDKNTVTADAEGADDTIDDAEKGTSTFVSPCAIPNIQRLNNTNIEVKRSLYMSSASEVKNDRVCLCIAPLALFRVLTPEGRAATTGSDSMKTRENFAYFASLEMTKAGTVNDDAEFSSGDVTGKGGKVLVVYEFNPLNHSINVLSNTPVDHTAHAIFALPAGDVILTPSGNESAAHNATAKYTGGPGGILLCTMNACEWLSVLCSHPNASTSSDRRFFFPRRFDMPMDSPIHIVAGTFQQTSTADGSLECVGLLQNALGDVYRLAMHSTGKLENHLTDKSLALTQRAELRNFAITFCDTIPVAKSMHFVNDVNAVLVIGESSGHTLYAIRPDSLRCDAQDAHEAILAHVSPNDTNRFLPTASTDATLNANTHIPIFHPRARRNFQPVQIIPNTSGMTQAEHFETTRHADGISYTENRLIGLCGDGARGEIVHFRSEIPSRVVSYKKLNENFPVRLFALTHKLSRKVAADSPLPDPHLLIFSYFDGTLAYSMSSSFTLHDKVLNAPEDTPEGSSEPKQPLVPVPFDNPTLTTTVLSNGDFIQIQKHKLLQFVTGQFRFWKPPADSTLFLATANASQIVVAVARVAEEADKAESQTVYFLQYFRQDESGVLRDPIKLPLNRRPISIALSSRTSLDACAPFLTVALDGGRVEIWELGKGSIGVPDAVYCILVLSVPFPVASLCLIANDCENTLHCVERMESGSGVFQRAQKWSLFIGYVNGLAEEKLLFEQNASDVSMRSLGNQQYQTISRTGASQQDVSSLSVRSSMMFQCGEESVRFQHFTQDISASMSLGGRSAKIVSMLYNAAVVVSSSTWLVTLPVAYTSQGQSEDQLKWDRYAQRIRLINEPVQDICFLGSAGTPAPPSGGESTQTVWKFRFAALLVRTTAIVVIELDSRDMSGFPLSAYQCLPLLGSMRGPSLSGIGFPMCVPPEDVLCPNGLSIATTTCAAMPKRIVGVPKSSLAVLIESSVCCYTEAETETMRSSLLARISSETGRTETAVYPSKIPVVKAPGGKWVSFLRVVDLSITRDFAKESQGVSEDTAQIDSQSLDALPSETDSITKDILELDGNLAAVSICWLGDTQCFLVGAVRDYIPAEKSCTTGVLLLFSCAVPSETSEGDTNDPFIELLHSTDVDGVPQALCALQSEGDGPQHIAIGIDDTLHIYAVGKAHMLKRYVHPPFPSRIAAIKISADRLFVADSTQSVFFLRYSLDSDKGTFECRTFADDCVMRWITAMEVLDYQTVAAADKFGNFFVLRVPRDIDDSFDTEDVSETESMLKQIHHLNRTNFYATGGNAAFLNACRQKSMLLAHFFVGDVITSIQCTSLSAACPVPCEAFAQRCARMTQHGEALPHSAEALSAFFREIDMQKASILLYSTMSGSIGYFVPITSPSDAQILEKAQSFFNQCGPLRCLEKNDGNAQQSISIYPPAAFPFTASGGAVIDNTFGFSMNLSETAMLGRDHVRYRSMTSPALGVIDGDFIHQCMRLWGLLAEMTAQGDLRVTLQQIVDGCTSTQGAVLGIAKVLANAYQRVFQLGVIQ